MNGFVSRRRARRCPSNCGALCRRSGRWRKRCARRGAAYRGGVETAIQTGSGFVIAERDDRVGGVVRWQVEEGIAWFSLLLSTVPGAGRTLVRAMEMRAQDHGLRLIRTRVPEHRRLPDVFLRWGYLPVGRVMVDGESVLTLEKRLPLLTVREQRRADAAAIGELTGEDPWVFEQGARPGWFVASDGERVIGVLSVRDAGAGTATIDVPTLDPAYRGRGIEVWMVDAPPRTLKRTATTPRRSRSRPTQTSTGGLSKTGSGNASRRSISGVFAARCRRRMIEERYTRRMASRTFTVVVDATRKAVGW